MYVKNMLSVFGKFEQRNNLSSSLFFKLNFSFNLLLCPCTTISYYFCFKITHFKNVTIFFFFCKILIGHLGKLIY